MSRMDNLESRVGELEDKLGILADKVVESVQLLADRAVANAMAKVTPPQEGKKGATK